MHILGLLIARNKYSIFLINLVVVEMESAVLFFIISTVSSQ